MYEVRAVLCVRTYCTPSLLSGTLLVGILDTIILERPCSKVSRLRDGSHPP